MDTNTFPWLELIDYPAFCVKDGVIVAANTLAVQREFRLGMDINEIITEHRDIYQSFESGNLNLNVKLYGSFFPASVVRTPECDIFRIQREEDDDILQALNLAGLQLNVPLSDLMIVADQQIAAIPSKTAQERRQESHFHKHLYKLMRIVCNMTDAGKYARTSPIPMETTNIVSFIAEIIEKTQSLFSSAKIRLVYSGPKKPVFTAVNPERIERAIYNLLSNAAKYSKRGSIVTASLTATESRLTFTVCNTNAAEYPTQNLWQQFRREPDLDASHGLGLGMTLAGAVVAAHKGTLLVDNPTPEQTRITMTIPITQTNSDTLRSPIVHLNDYAGGRDKGLLELSDVLPADAYRKYK